MSTALKALVLAVIAANQKLLEFLLAEPQKEESADDMADLLGGGSGAPAKKPAPPAAKPAPTPAKPTPPAAKPTPPAAKPAPATPPAPAANGELAEMGAADLRLLLRHMNNKVRETITPKSKIAQMKADEIRAHIAKNYSPDALEKSLVDYKTEPTEPEAPAETPAETPAEAAPAETGTPADATDIIDAPATPENKPDPDIANKLRNAAVAFADANGRDALRAKLNKYTHAKGTLADLKAEPAKMAALLKDLTTPAA